MEPEAGLEEQQDWEGGFALISHTVGTTTHPISATTFDCLEDLLWTGNQHGRVVSYHSTMLQRYTAFTVPASVRALESFEAGVIVVHPTGVRVHNRHAVHLMNYQSERMAALSCMLRPVEAPSTLYLGGEQPDLIHYDFEKQRELRMVKVTQKNVKIIRSNGINVITASSTGTIALRDPNSMETVREFAAHAGPVMDFDVVGTQLVSCGVSMRAGTMHGDPYLKVYDLRMCRALSPHPLSFAPAYARFIPSYTTSKVLVLSQMAQLHLLDLNDLKSVPQILESLSSAPITAFALAPSTQIIACGDAGGCIHLYADRDEAAINPEATESDFADIVVPPEQSFSIEDQTHSLAAIPLPFTADEGYLSEWPDELCEYTVRRPKPLPEHSAVRTVQFVGYATNSRHGTPLARFNVCPYIMEEVDEKVEEEREVLVPRFYKPVVCKQTVKSADELAFLLKYNRTERVPIEYNQGANYANPLAQMLWSIPAIRNAFLMHLCDVEHCVPCQLAFLFRMMTDRPPGQPASSNNLLRALRATPTALMTPGMSKAEKASHLLLKIFSFAYKNMNETEAERLHALLDYHIIVNTRCVRCGKLGSAEKQMPVFMLQYPAAMETPISFCTLFERSLNARRSTQKECEECATTTRQEETLRVRSLPPVMIIDAQSGSIEPNTPFWKAQLSRVERRPCFLNPPPSETERSEKMCRWGEDCRKKQHCKYMHQSPDWQAECAGWMEEGRGSWAHYVPQMFYARVAGGIAAMQTMEPDVLVDRSTISQYHLVAVECMVSEDPRSPTWKLVLSEVLEKWEKRNAQRKEDEDAELTWLLINGVAITRVSQDEALHLDVRWKLPLAFIYVRDDCDAMTVKEERYEIPSDVFLKDANLTGNNDVAAQRRQLSIPSKGDIVGIDAEFISMSKDGSKKNVGRVSCVDASGERVFMDDYIVALDNDVVHDYLTQYSGIEEHDLCRLRSTKHLTTLKATYVKLLHLIDRGVIFVGHAVFNDFAMLNIYVPQEQVRDTVQLFRLPQKRLISLQFLAYHLLHTKIQEDRHDSIEDARISLQLFRKWEQLHATGQLDSAIKWLYETGNSTNWKLGTPSLAVESSATDSNPATPAKGSTPAREVSPVTESGSSQ